MSNLVTEEGEKKWEISFFEPTICFCEDDYIEEIPDDAELCPEEECMERKLKAWDDEFEDEICICFNDTLSAASKPSRSSGTKEKLLYDYSSTLKASTYSANHQFQLQLEW